MEDKEENPLLPKKIKYVKVIIVPTISRVPPNIICCCLFIKKKKKGRGKFLTFFPSGIIEKYFKQPHGQRP